MARSLCLALPIRPVGQSFLRCSSRSVASTCSQLEQVQVPEQSLPEYLTQKLKRASLSHSSPFIIDHTSPKPRHVSFDEAFAQAGWYQDWLKSKGVEKGDHVHLVMGNNSELVCLLIAAVFSGISITVGNPDSPESEIARQAKICRSKLVVSGACAGSGEILDVTEKEWIAMQAPPPLQRQPGRDLTMANIDPDEILLLPFSSGTTGLSKAIKLSHKNVVASMIQLLDEGPDGIAQLDIRSCDRILCWLPSYGIFGLSTILAGISRGATLVLADGSDIRPILKLARQEKISVVPLRPHVAKLLLKSPGAAEDLKSVRFLYTGGAKLDSSAEESLGTMLPHAVVGQLYGMTETAGAVAVPMTFSNVYVPGGSVSGSGVGSVGQVLRNLELKFEQGEICIRGPQVMQGYIGGEEGSNPPLLDGWFHTGDIGYVDSCGQLRITDRVKDTFESSGFQVSPAELEGIIAGHPGVEEVVVVGIRDKPVAFVVANSPTSDVTGDEIKMLVDAKVKVSYKFLKDVVFVEEIPRKPDSGKVDRKELARMYENRE